MFFTGEQGKGLRLDPRTKMILFLAVIIGVFMNVAGRYTQYIFPVMCALPLLMMALSGKAGLALRYAVVFAVFYALERWSVVYASGLLKSLIALNCYIVLRFFPTAMMGMYMMSTTTVSEFMAAMQRMHVTDKLTIPLAVMFRFFPTLMEEMRAINDSMKMRGIYLGGGKASKMLEYRIVPLMMCTVNIGEELSQAAITRGLKTGEGRTNNCRIGFHAADVIVILVSLASMILTGVK